MFIESPISGHSPLTTQVSEEFPDFELFQPEYQPQVPASSEIFVNQDILGVILQDFEHDKSLKATRKNLCLAALTSKAFLEPAMNLLWSSLDSLMPLLNLLPSFAPINNVYVFAGGVKEEHWERFDYYARRVKFLTAIAPWPHTRVAVSDYVYLRIAQARLSYSSSPLFPALQRLRIPDVPHPPSTGLTAAFLVSSPSLESVELQSQATSDPQFFASYLSFLVAESAPTLRCLILRGKPCSEFLTLLGQLRNIRTLEISFPELSFSPDLLGTLASLEYLSDLIIDSAPPLTSPSPKSKSSRGMGRGAGRGRAIPRVTDRVPLLKLDQLNHLQITGSPTALSHVLGHLRALDLKSMVVKIRAETTSEHRPSTSLDSECFKGIAQSPSMSSIHIAETEICSVILTISDIRPLLTLSQLEELDISVSSMYGGDELIQEISSNLPILKTLILPSKWDQNDFFQPKKPTFRSLNILADNCLDLIQIKLAINLAPDDFPSFHNNTVAARRCSHPLKALYIADTNPNGEPLTTTQAIAISRYIDHIFPNLGFLGNYGSGNRFTGVEEIWSAFQAVRRDIRESLVEKTPKSSYVSKATQTTYVDGGTDFT